MTQSMRSIILGGARRTLLLSGTVLAFGLIPPVCANQRQSTTDRIIIPVDDRTPHPKELEHHDLFAQARLRVLPNGTVAAVTFDRSSGFPNLDAAAAKFIEGWKIPRSLVYDTIVVPMTFTLKSRESPLTKGYQPLPGEKIHIP
jgi:TonB family protein